MATQTKQGMSDKLFVQLEQLREQAVNTARETGTKYLDSYEQAVDQAIDMELTLVGLTEQEWLKGLIDSHVKLTRELTDAYVSVSRTLLK